MQRASWRFGRILGTDNMLSQASDAVVALLES